LMNNQLTFEQALRTREFEPDDPNYTPRISGIIKVEPSNTFNYALSILKSADGNPESCHRFTFSYNNPINGEGHFIHTYMGDVNPLPSFEGEPKLISIPNNIEELSNMLWENLNSDNKVSLFVRYIDLNTGKYKTKIINKNC
ncbi:MAG: IMP cyclohydrolase, partial [Oscillospiraceae bacterium]|nr:IMP cyclohydrolase [Oscillospiraceae bacterium]